MNEMDRLTRLLNQIRPLYDESLSLYLYWTELQTVPTAVADYEEALTVERAAVKQANEQLRNLRYEEWSLSNGMETQLEELPYDPGFEPIREPSTERKRHEGDRAITPRPDNHQTREDLQRNVRRFIRHRLKPETLAEYNRLAKNSDVPMGRLLCVLDWDVAYAEPLNDRETSREQILRLENWGDILATYRDNLLAETTSLERRYRPSLQIWEMWRKRAVDPTDWERAIASSRRDLGTQLRSLEHQIEVLIQQVERLRAEPRHRDESARLLEP